jgi:chemotaxis protein CheC
MPKTLFDPSNSAIILKTVFCFNERNVNGFLFLITSHNSVIWLKKALADFMEQYE